MATQFPSRYLALAILQELRQAPSRPLDVEASMPRRESHPGGGWIPFRYVSYSVRKLIPWMPHYGFLHGLRGALTQLCIAGAVEIRFSHGQRKRPRWIRLLPGATRFSAQPRRKTCLSCALKTPREQCPCCRTNLKERAS